MFLICLYVSQRGRGVAIRICVLLCIGALTRSAEFLNGIAAQHWQSFATQNYFDRSGIFIGIFFCGPLLLNCFIMLTLMIREASNLLIEVKTMELKKKMSGAKKESVDKSRGKKSKSNHNKQD
jgi:transmembrane protein 18